MHPIPSLPVPLAREILAAPREVLPPPADNTPEACHARDMIATNFLVSLEPVDACEAMLAVQVVATEAHARDCMRLAIKHRPEIRISTRCRNQAASMARQMLRAMQALEKRRATRSDRPAPSPMVEVAFQEPEPPPPPPPPTMEPPPPPPVPEVIEVEAPRRTNPTGDYPLVVLKAADAYALRYPMRAARIRCQKEWPAWALARIERDAVPLPPNVAEAVAFGDTTLLRALDELIRQWIHAA